MLVGQDRKENDAGIVTASSDSRKNVAKHLYGLHHGVP